MGSTSRTSLNKNVKITINKNVKLYQGKGDAVEPIEELYNVGEINYTFHVGDFDHNSKNEETI